MDVFIDGRWPPATGIGVVAQEVLARAPAEARITFLDTRQAIGNPLSPFALSRALARANARGGVFWNPGFVPPASAPVPRVVTVHDLTHLHFYSKLHAAYYRLVLRPLFRSVEKLICVSRYTAEELCDWCGLDISRVDIIPNGVSPRFRFCLDPDLAARNAPYVLYPGNRRKYKNLERLICSFAASKLPGEGFELHLTGKPDAALLRFATEVGCNGQLRFTGMLTDAELAECYAKAHAVAFVSLYEGFGLPVLEGMASGVPVLTSNVSALPEVAGDAALLVNPYSVESIRAGLESICLDRELRRRCTERGLARAREFSWDTTAAATWSTVRAAADMAR